MLSRRPRSWNRRTCPEINNFFYAWQIWPLLESGQFWEKQPLSYTWSLLEARKLLKEDAVVSWDWEVELLYPKAELYIWRKTKPGLHPGSTTPHCHAGCWLYGMVEFLFVREGLRSMLPSRARWTEPNSKIMEVKLLQFASDLCLECRVLFQWDSIQKRMASRNTT